MLLHKWYCIPVEDVVGKADMINPYESLWHWVAYDLRRFRKAHGQRQVDVASHIGVSLQSLCNYEANDRKLQPDQAEKLDDLWETCGHFARLVFYARLNHDPDWFKQYSGYEARALKISAYEGLLIPGLIQTQEYARACMEAGRVFNIEAAVDSRMKRQQVVTRPKAPDIWVIVDQAALVHPVGGPAVHRAQLEHLLRVSHMPNVSVRVVPYSAGAHPGLDGAFNLIKVREGDVAFVEAPEGGRLVLDSAGVDAFSLRWERIGAVSLPEGPSRSLITQLMESTA